MYIIETGSIVSVVVVSPIAIILRYLFFCWIFACLSEWNLLQEINLIVSGARPCFFIIFIFISFMKIQDQARLYLAVLRILRLELCLAW